MRLSKLESGHRPHHKLLMRVMRMVLGSEPPDIIKTLYYRGNLWGNPQKALTQAVMRGPSEWSLSERELLAAFVSQKNQCLF